MGSFLSEIRGLHTLTDTLVHYGYCKTKLLDCCRCSYLEGSRQRKIAPLQLLPLEAICMTPPTVCFKETISHQLDFFDILRDHGDSSLHNNYLIFTG